MNKELKEAIDKHDKNTLDIITKYSKGLTTYQEYLYFLLDEYEEYCNTIISIIDHYKNEIK